MSDLLRNLYLDVHCGQCGDFAVRADVVAESQRLLANGCPGSPHECPPTLLATLLDRRALDLLERAWRGLEAAARSPVRQVSVSDSLRLAVRPSEELEARAIFRWEDDGGYIPTTFQSPPG